MLEFEGKFIKKKVNNDLPPPRPYRKCIKSTLKLCNTLRKKQGEKSAKNHGKGKKIKIGVEYIPQSFHDFNKQKLFISSFFSGL